MDLKKPADVGDPHHHHHHHLEQEPLRSAAHEERLRFNQF